MTINTGQYCLLNNSLSVVLQGPQQLPQNWNQYLNINNSDIWSNDDLRNIGWFPYTLIDSGSPLPEDAYIRSLSAFNIGALEVTQTAIYTQRDIDELRVFRNIQLEQNRRHDITFFDSIIDDLVRYQITDMEEWIAQEQIKLAELTDWNAVANFQTVSPQVLELGNQYVAIQYQEQGASLTAVNQAAIGSGQQAPYDQTLIDTFVSNNEPAATDSSGVIAPVPPPHQLRQAVANVSEQRSILWIYRTDGDQYVELALTNRQDARDLYVFFYLAPNTYLFWVKFEQDPNNQERWIARSPVGQEHWMSNDLMLRLSYSTNPAVEADLFTDDLLFDAGSDPIKTVVRWDTEV